MQAKIMGYTVRLRQGEDDWVVAWVPALQGCHTQGKTPEQALERIREAIQLCLETDHIVPAIRSRGMKLPTP